MSACDLYLRKAADEGIISTGAVLCVQAVVEEASVAGGDAVQTDVELRCDAAPQVVASAGELRAGNHIKLARQVICKNAKCLMHEKLLVRKKMIPVL